MAVVLRCTDRWGRVVVLHDTQWTGHIESKHGEMVGQLQAVGQAIVAPTQVSLDQLHANGENFYLYGVLPAPLDQSYLKVCVRYSLLAPNGPWEGSIVTAYGASVIKRAEKKRWP